MPSPQEIVTHATDTSAGNTSESYRQAATALITEVQSMSGTTTDAAQKQLLQDQVMQGLQAANVLPEVTLGFINNEFATIAASDANSSSISQYDLEHYITMNAATNPMAAALVRTFKDTYFQGTADASNVLYDSPDGVSMQDLNARMGFLRFDYSATGPDAPEVMDMLLQERNGNGNMFDILEEFRLWRHVGEPGNDQKLGRDDVIAGINELVAGSGPFYEWVNANYGSDKVGQVTTNLMWLRDNWDSLKTTLGGASNDNGYWTPNEIADGLGLPGVQTYEEYKAYRTAHPLEQTTGSQESPVTVVEPPVAPQIVPADQSTLRSTITRQIQNLEAGERLALQRNSTFFDANGNFKPQPTDSVAAQAWADAKDALPEASENIIQALQGYFATYGELDIDQFIQQGLVPQVTDTAVAAAAAPTGDMAAFMSTNQVTTLRSGEHVWQIAQRALKARGVDVKFGDPAIQAEVERIMVLNGYRSSDGSIAGKNWNSISSNQQFLIYGPNDAAITAPLAAALANGTARLINGEIVMTAPPPTAS